MKTRKRDQSPNQRVPLEGLLITITTITSIIKKKIKIIEKLLLLDQVALQKDNKISTETHLQLQKRVQSVHVLVPCLHQEIKISSSQSQLKRRRVLQGQILDQNLHPETGTLDQIKLLKKHKALHARNPQLETIQNRISKEIPLNLNPDLPQEIKI
jgi:hypothetical protein